MTYDVRSGGRDHLLVYGLTQAEFDALPVLQSREGFRVLPDGRVAKYGGLESPPPPAVTTKPGEPRESTRRTSSRLRPGRRGYSPAKGTRYSPDGTGHGGRRPEDSDKS